MQQSRAVEVLVGLFVAAGVVALFFLAMKVSNLSVLQNDDGYKVKARFENVGSLKVRSPVSIAGVRIGRISAINYDIEGYEAIVEMLIESHYDMLPTDTTASVFTAGLLGEQYIGLDPGGEEEYLKNGDFLEFTQSALVLEEIIGKLLFNKIADSSND